MKFLKSKRLGIIVMFAVILMFAGVVLLSISSYQKSLFIETPYMFLEGEYSIDDGEWKPIELDKPIKEAFHTIRFIGTIPESTFEKYSELTITTKNVWVKWYVLDSDGYTIIKHEKDFLKETIDRYEEVYKGEDLEGDLEIYVDGLKKNYPFAYDLKQTPGYYCDSAPLDKIESWYPDAKFCFELENPYDFAPSKFSDIFTVTLSSGNSVHARLIEQYLPLMLLFAVICLFGIFFFPIAGFILGRVDFKYISFGALCFFWGIYMAMQVLSGYLNYWIRDPAICLFIDKMNSHFFVISLLIYFRSNLSKPISRAVSGIMTVCVTIAVMVSAVLHIFAVSDMVVTGAYVNIIMELTAAVFIILLSSEIKSSRIALLSMIMWTPMIIGLILDIFNQFISFTSLHFFTYGLAVTMLAQIVQIIFDLRKQRLEAVRYQQIQKELYEAKVSVMVSQIRPHFMYNALSSIAMLCKIKPDTAYEATVKFSDYLRGNMDSLKQTAPVPFKKELEHLEKYLYIEKLRFGKKLNIEYDIQADSFEIPLLSVQPLVENAVKHGVGMKEDGGTVTIATKETDDSFEIVISDDGVGFDVNEVKDDGRSHVGMENTKRRLKDMCGADIEITSVIGEGTTARIIIPKVKEETE